jgi:hypothetical protein
MARLPRGSPLVVALACAFGLTACNDSTSYAPAAPADYTFRIISGDSQVGVLGHTLRQPLVIGCREDNGGLCDGVVLRFAVTRGSGRMHVGTATIRGGQASDRLTLDPAGLMNTVEVLLVDAGTGTETPVLHFRALGLPIEPITWFGRAPGGRLGLYVGDLEGRSWPVEGMQGIGEELDWAPLTASVAFTSNAELRVIDELGLPARHLQTGLGVHRPQWSPSARTMVFECLTPWEDGPDSDICVTDARAFNVRHLTLTPGVPEWSPAWSPDGTRLAFARRDTTGAVAVSGIYVMDAELGVAEPVLEVTGLAPFPARSIRWSPDGTRIAFINDGVWIVNADGSGLTNTGLGCSGEEAGCTFAQLDWAREGWRLLLSESCGGPGDPTGSIWIALTNGTGLRRVARTACDAAWGAPPWSALPPEE